MPQGSVLGPLLFLIFINDICLNIKSIIQLYADDTSLFQVVKSRNIISAISDLNADLRNIFQWSNQWLVEVHAGKSVAMLISKKRSPTVTLPIVYGTSTLEYVTAHTHLGVTMNSKFTWNDHIDVICTKASKRIYLMSALRYKLNRNTLELIYKSYVRPLLEYGDIIYGNSNNNQMNQLEDIQRTAARIVTGAKRCTSHALLYKEVGWDTLASRRQIHRLVMIHQIIYKTAPQYLHSIIPRQPNENEFQ